MDNQSVNKIQKKLLFDESKSMGLGCLPCPDRNVCGGIHTSYLYDCLQLCCNNPSNCDYACPKDVENYVTLIRSVKGFEFDNIPHSKPLEYKHLPEYVPLVYNSSSRIESFEYETVAVQLTRLYDFDKKEFKFHCKEEICDYFGFSPNCNILISGVKEDVPLEKYWFIRKTKGFVKQLFKLQPTLVTAPNFSTFSNSPRMDNLFNMKRILICWSELIEQGIPAALHTNGRTLKDWERLTEFIAKRPEVKSISFEFATLFPERKSWYVDRLIELSNSVNRQLQLVVRGGSKHLEILHRFYKQLVFIDSDAFFKSVMRKQIQPNGKLSNVASLENYYIDDLLKSNIKAKSNILKEKIRG